MNITPQMRNEEYRKLHPILQMTYGSDEATKMNSIIIHKHELDEDQAKEYMHVVGDTILGFHKTADIPRLLQERVGVGADQSHRIMSDLIEYLSPVIEREQKTTNIKKEDIDKLAETFEAANQGRPKEVRPEGSPGDVQPLRTMRGDMNRVHGYGAFTAQETNDDEPVVQASTQDELVSSTAEPAPAPKPSQPVSTPEPAPAPLLTTKPVEPKPPVAPPTPITPPSPSQTTADSVTPVSAQEAIDAAAAAVSLSEAEATTLEETAEPAPADPAATQAIPIRKVD